jgi:hypothetical protein
VGGGGGCNVSAILRIVLHLVAGGFVGGGRERFGSG